MIHGKTVLLFTSGVLLAAASTVTAQSWGSERPPRDGVCFYEDADYRGNYFCARPGDEESSLPSDINDRISSIRVYGRAEVEIFQDPRFLGDKQRFGSDVRDLKSENWNDRISSFQVRSTSRSGGDPDKIVRRAYEDILDREPDSAGLRTYRSHIIDDGWTETEVRDALRKSSEYRQKTTMTPAKAEEVVRRAYQSVLGREPDAGSRMYVDRVLRDKWTQQDVERELRKSGEYRNKNR
jgi:hypothetical protein